jgi:Polyketide cyclase / dehydrase and lipid transport
MLGFGRVTIDAPPTAVWSLVARPGRWHEWSPYVVGAEGLGEPEVEEGAVGSVLLRGGLRVGTEILEVVLGRSWAWRVKGLVIRHEVEPVPGGTRLSMTPKGDGPLLAPLALAYRLPTALIARNVARVAGRD